MAFLKPQSPLSKGNDYFYPLTTADQVIMDGGYRLDQIVGKVEKSTITLYQNGWSAAAPYSYSIMVKGLTDDLNMKVLPHYPENFAEKQVLKEELAKVSFCSRQGNIVTFECWDEVPTVDINVDIEINVLYPLEAAVDMNEIESLLPKLNYSIVGGTTEPSNPTENMIWVNTDQEITNYELSKNEPKNPIEGMVWILLGESSSVAFYRFNVNGIGFDEVYPISASQYIDGTWVDLIALSYQGSEWVDWWCGQIIDGGILPNPPFGKLSLTKVGYSSAMFGMSEEEGGLYFYVPVASSSYTKVYMTPKINLTNYSKLTVKWKAHGYCPAVGFVDTVNTAVADQSYVACATITNKSGTYSSVQTHTVDISSLAGAYTFCVSNAGTAASGNYSGEIIIFEAILS